MSLSRAVRTGLLALAGLVVMASTFVVVLIAAQTGETMPNTRVAGVDVSRMSPEEVRATIAPVAVERSALPVTLTIGGTEHVLVPSSIAQAIDVDASVRVALDRGRRGSPLAFIERLTSLWVTVDLPLVVAWDERALGRWVDGVIADTERREDAGGFTIDPASGTVTAIEPQGALRLDRERVMRTIARELVERAGSATVEAEVGPAPVGMAEVEALAARLEDALAERTGHVLIGEAGRLEVPDELLASAAGVGIVDDAAGRRAVLVLDPAVLERGIGATARRTFDREPVAARFALERRPPIDFDEPGTTSFEPVPIPSAFIEGRDGARFDPERLAAQLARMVVEGVREAPIDLEVVEPELPNDEARRGAPTHLLGTFTTYFTPGQQRNTNIRLLADIIDGAVVAPGEQFSINELSGPRTCDVGYVPAGTIVAGELIDTCGGGVSQFGTTTFNAAFFAGVRLDQWKAHSWYISRYPMGREATLTYPSLDVLFTNTTEGWLVVRTAHTDRSVTVSIYGRPRYARVTATLGTPSDVRAAPVRRQPDPALPEGVERVLQAGGGGFAIEVVRGLEPVDGPIVQERLRTVYLGQPRIVAVGTGIG
ncbi:MAG: hypothetical protein RLZZ272_1477 [Actinomycetota bacterium]